MDLCSEDWNLFNYLLQIDHHQIKTLAIGEMSRLEEEITATGTKVRVCMVWFHTTVCGNESAFTRCHVDEIDTSRECVACCIAAISGGVTMPETTTT